MSDHQDECTCSTEGYSTECPKVFYQNGTPLHSMEREVKLRPRIFAPQQYQHHDGSPPINRSEQCESPDDAIRGQPESMWVQRQSAIDMPAPLQARTPVKSYHGKTRMQTDEMLMEQNRGSLRRFEALTLGDKSLTEVSIGGFDIDLTEVASKVREVAPLPPSKLPVIFKDNELNFLHHFIQGLEIILGRSVLLEIVENDRYYDGEPKRIIPIIISMIKDGYDRSDNEIAIFTKKVVTSTFKMLNEVTGEGGEEMVGVASNMWGFQYIEQGMQCKEADLQMWIYACYQHYKIVWFNTFKAAGVPAFASDGVQTRYGRPQKERSISIQEIDNSQRRLFESTEDRLASLPLESRSQKQYRRRRSHRSEQDDKRSLFSYR